MVLRVILLCGLVWIALPAAAYDGAVDVVQACAAKAAKNVVGIEELQRSCPDLSAALNALGFAERLQPGWEKKINVETLRNLVALHERYSDDSNYDAPKTDSLHKVIGGLGQAQTSDKQSWWQSVLSWLRKMFTPGSNESPEWLRTMLRQLSVPEIVLRIFVYASIATVIGLAIAVVIIELRAAGVFGARSGRSGSSVGRTANREASVQQLALDDVDAAKWNDRPAILLRLLAARLMELKLLQSEKSLTHRELSRRVQLPNPEDRERFTKLALLAEKLRFGSAVTHDPEMEKGIERTIADNRTLLNALSGEYFG